MSKMKPQTIKRRNANRKIRTAKTLTAREAIGTIEKDSDTFILTFGQFSLIDALVVILDQTGPADVVVSTWTAADADLQRSAELIANAEITRFRMILDRSFWQRQPEYCHHMETLFGRDCLVAVKSHAKFMLIRSATHNVVVRTSMNLNENPRLENIEIAESAEFADYFSRIADEVFGEANAGSRPESPPILAGLPDDYPFPELDARHIPRSSTNEPAYTHTIRKS